MNREQKLFELASIHGLRRIYVDGFGVERTAGEAALTAILRSLGVGVSEGSDVGVIDDALRARRLEIWRRVIEPVVVAWDEQPARLALRQPQAASSNIVVEVECEDGETLSHQTHSGELPVRHQTEESGETFRELELTLPRAIPHGYHRLSVEIGAKRYTSLLLAAPTKAWLPPESQAWGVFLPLYSLYGQESLGCGDLGDLRALIQWTSELGGQVVGTLPLHAAFLDQPFEYSPYVPVSRLFWNEFFVDLDQIPELGDCASAQERLASDAFVREAAALRDMPLVDYRRQMALKRSVLKELQASAFAEGIPEGVRALLGTNDHVQDYARFRATVEARGEVWHRWPERLRQGDLRTGDYEESAYQYHLYVQQCMAAQMEALSEHARELGAGLYLDMPFGVHPDGYDAWRFGSSFLPGCSAGAPPDVLFTKGQDWGFRAAHPERAREDGYRYLRACLQHQCQRAGALRIDHVMGLHRMFCIPFGMEATDGLYLYQRPEELYALLTLESHRHQTMLIGEDLGTVPDEIRAAMNRHGLQRMFVLQFNIDPYHNRPISRVPTDSVASVNTHDTPLFRGFWEGRDIDDLRALSLVTEQKQKDMREERRVQVDALADHLGTWYQIGDPPDPVEVLRASLKELAASKARLVLVNLEDLWLEGEPQNVPGTCQERPNWRRKAQYSFEAFTQLLDVEEILQEVDSQRRRPRANKGEELDQGSPLSEDDVFLFNEGTHYRLYQKLGAHSRVVDGVAGTWFSVWAPNAERVTVFGNFNGWNKGANDLYPRGSSGIWEGFVAGLRCGEVYKYHIVARGGHHRVDKADPFGFHHETPPHTASIVWDLDYVWHDDEWLEQRHSRQQLDAPMSIYEVHLGSWMRVPEDHNRSLSYRELAPRLCDHVMRHGFTHVQLMPVMEHPFGGSWGYQVSGFFAPTARFGTPQDLMYLVDYLHQHGIGVFCDWVPAHFPTDDHGLGYFDGTHLFEHADPRRGFHPDWNTFIFNYGRHEVRSFLLSAAIFWLDRYHFDGLRVDGVASMLYLDYSREPGQWIPNEYGGNENIPAVDFLRKFNEVTYEHYPDVQTIAEESTSWAMVSRPTSLGGLGFGLKWDMGWMHDTLEYFRREPIHRKYHHNALTFRLMYAFYENFVLPLSHDEVVHGKGSLVGKMPGDDWQRFANLRLLYGYMWATPGKKLLFMGGEFGQQREWIHDSSLEWHVAGMHFHRGVMELVAHLNYLHRSEPALHELDVDPAGFEWLVLDDHDNSVLAFERHGRDSEEKVVFVGNFTPVPRHDYRIGVPGKGFWRELANTDAEVYGGSGMGNAGGVWADPIGWQGRPWSVCLTLPPLAALFLKAS